MNLALQIVTTTSSREDALRIAERLVADRLAACVQVEGPIRSVYRWQGQVESADEWRCTAKTLAHRYDAVERTIRQLHPYDEPEIVATRIEGGSASYLRWLAEQLEAADP